MNGDEDKKKKKKKKRNGIEGLLEEGGAELEALSDQCMILDNLEKRCKGVDALSGDLHQDLLPACGVHQLCYLCVSKLKILASCYVLQDNQVLNSGKHSDYIC